VTEIIRQILERLSAVEAAIGQHDNVTPEAEPDQRLPTTAVAGRYGVSMRTIERWYDDPDLGFPKPDIVKGRKYWWLSALQHYDRRTVSTAATRRPPAARRAGRTRGGA
jgi:hypothetical protein